jgi:RimJ/RimL family protein N-acetyltransferase
VSSILNIYLLLKGNGITNTIHFMTSEITLRHVALTDLPIFFEQQQEPEAVHMAAFTAKDPTDRETFNKHWQKIMADNTIIIRTIIWDGQVAGYMLSYEENGKPEVSYWLGKTFWGQGIATQALKTFLAEINQTRPIYGRAAKDNLGSIRVLEKCGFKVIDETRGFANARGEEIEELILQLK